MLTRSLLFALSNECCLLGAGQSHSQQQNCALLEPGASSVSWERKGGQQLCVLGQLIHSVFTVIERLSCNWYCLLWYPWAQSIPKRNYFYLYLHCFIKVCGFMVISWSRALLAGCGAQLLAGIQAKWKTSSKRTCPQ